MQNMNETINFYNINAISYFEKTVEVDMSETYKRFVEHMKPHGVIIDTGAGSGRDVKYFLESGFKVHGIDASKELCKLSSEYTGVRIKCQTIQEWKPYIQYDGIWANASLIHLKKSEVEDFIKRLPEVISADGVIYISLKEKIKEGFDKEGRYFNGLTINDIIFLLSQIGNYLIVENWISEDALLRQDVKWRNIIIRKKFQNNRC